MLGGMRHLVWDTGQALDKTSIEVLAWLTIIGSITLTVLIWYAGYAVRGRPSMATPLKKVRGLGAAHGGTETFWRQRLTALANIPLTIFLIYSIVNHIGADYGTVKPISPNPSSPR